MFNELALVAQPLSLGALGVALVVVGIVADASSPRRRANALHELFKLGWRSCMFVREGGEHDQQRSAYCHDQHSARG